MDDEHKNKAELIAELVALRQQVAELENGSLNEFVNLGIVKSLLDYAPVPIAILDKDENFIFFNDAFEDILGYKLQDLPTLDRWWLLAYPDETYRAAMIANWQKASLNQRQNPKIRVPARAAKVSCKDGVVRIFEINGTQLELNSVVILVDITEKVHIEDQQRRLIKELKNALAEIKNLSGLLPICASCKKIRDDKGYWSQIESYIQTHSEAKFSHGICPDCAKKLYQDYDL